MLSYLSVLTKRNLSPEELMYRVADIIHSIPSNLCLDNLQFQVQYDNTARKSHLKSTNKKKVQRYLREPDKWKKEKDKGSAKKKTDNKKQQKKKKKINRIK